MITKTEVSAVTENAATVSWHVTGDGSLQSWAEYGNALGNMPYRSQTRQGSGPIEVGLDTLSGSYYVVIVASNDSGTTRTGPVGFTTTAREPTGRGQTMPGPSDAPEAAPSGPPASTPPPAPLAIASFKSIASDSQGLRVRFTVAGGAPITTKVEFGLTTAYGQQTALVTGDAGERTVTLSGLATATQYHLRVKATNATQTATSPDLSLSTTQSMSLTSTVFVDGGSIPVLYTCHGANRSPPLTIANPPMDTQSFALVVDDPDAGTFTHWLTWDIPATKTTVPYGQSMPAWGAREGTNDFANIGYDGPCPPPGPVHHYSFRAYALDASLALPSTAVGPDVAAALVGPTIESATLMGTFS